MKNKTMKIFNQCALLLLIAAFVLCLVSFFSGSMFPQTSSNELGQAIGDSCRTAVISIIVIFTLIVHAITIIVFTVALIFGEKKTAAGAFIAVFCFLLCGVYIFSATEYASTYTVKPEAFSLSGFAALCFGAACALLGAACSIYTAIKTKKMLKLSAQNDGAANTDNASASDMKDNGEKADKAYIVEEESAANLTKDNACTIDKNNVGMDNK